MAERKEKPGEQAGFEQSLEHLEKIVADMESGTLSLEEMTTHFEKGTALVKYCSDKLNEVERKIELLVKQGEKTVTEPFETGTDGGKDPF
ncbi:MAG: exodeoxyribonuclease VII small subunit [Spartobacteria bacterium]|nr:exodeoxyribonuclease VII small subunit [Spartobacteria bacterium]